MVQGWFRGMGVQVRLLQYGAVKKAVHSGVLFSEILCSCSGAQLESIAIK